MRSHGQSPHDGISALIRIIMRGIILCRMRRQQEGAICKPRPEPSPKPNHAGTLVSKLQPPELRNLCCLSHPAYGLLFSLTKQQYSSLNCLRQNQRFQRSFKLLYPNEVLEHLVSSIQLNTQGLSTMKSKEWKIDFISYAHCGTGCQKCYVINNPEALLRFSRKGPVIDQ